MSDEPLLPQVNALGLPDIPISLNPLGDVESQTPPKKNGLTAKVSNKSQHLSVSSFADDSSTDASGIFDTRDTFASAASQTSNGLINQSERHQLPRPSMSLVDGLGSKWSITVIRVSFTLY